MPRTTRSLVLSPRLSPSFGPDQAVIRSRQGGALKLLCEIACPVWTAAWAAHTRDVERSLSRLVRSTRHVSAPAYTLSALKKAGVHVGGMIRKAGV